MNVSIALAMIAALGFSGAALADDTVKSGYPEGKAGRAVDGETVKSGGREGKFGRAVDGDIVKSGGREKKFGRAVEGDTIKSGGREGKFGRAIGRNDGGAKNPVAKVEKKQTAKSDYAAAKPGRRIEKTN